MANVCNYKIIVKGKKNSCYAFMGSTLCLDFQDIDWENTNDDGTFEMRFDGDCKWAVDSYCNDRYKGEIPVFIPDDPEEALKYASENYCGYTVKVRSKMFQVEVKCNSADVEYDPENIENFYEHYDCGRTLGGKCPEELEIESLVWE